MNDKLRLAVLHDNHLTAEQLTAIHELCNQAYEEDLRFLFTTFSNATHVIGMSGESIVSHAMWVTRWLQIGDNPILRTAYVEMVATEPHFQRRGFATKVMRTRSIRAIAVILHQRNRGYNRCSMNGSSPYKAMEVDLCVRSPAENSGLRQYDLNTGGASIWCIL